MRERRESEVKACPQCDSKNILKDIGSQEIYCNDCGVVISDFDAQPTWDEECRIDKDDVQFSNNFDDSMQTYVGNGKDEEVDTKRGRKLKRVNRSLRYKDKAQSQTDGEIRIRTICSHLSLPDLVKSDSIILFNKLKEKEYIKEGRHISAAVVYWSCRQCRYPRTVSEIADEIDTDENKIRSVYKSICRELDTGHLPFTAEEYVDRYLNELDINGSHRNRAKDIIKDLGDYTNGKNPRAVVGAIIRYVMKDRNDLSYKEISNVVGVTADHIRVKAKEMSHILNT